MQFREWVNRHVVKRLMLSALVALCALLALQFISVGMAYKKQRAQFDTFREIIETAVRNRDVQSIQKTALLLLRDLRGSQVALYDNSKKAVWSYPSGDPDMVFFTHKLEAPVAAVEGDMLLQLEVPLIPNRFFIVGGVATLIISMGLLAWMLRGVAMQLSGQLSRQLSGMLHGCSHVFIDEIREAGEELVSLREKERLQAEALRKRSEVEAMGNMSSQIAHDMRSPLSVLKSYVQMSAQEQTVSQSIDGEYSQAARRSVDKLLRMAEELVDFAKASRIEIKPESGKSIVQDAVSEVAVVANGSGVVVSAELDHDGVIKVDGHKLRRVVVNLLSNAIQACEGPQGKVKVSSTILTDGSWVLMVEDDGKGISEEDVGRVFDRLFTKGKKGGTGLGLSYCKQVVEAHGGRIEVESQLGQGAVFRIILPGCIDGPHQ